MPKPKSAPQLRAKGRTPRSRFGRKGPPRSKPSLPRDTTYTFEKTNTDIYFTVKNLFDEEFIVDRTRGILPGAPRLVQADLKQNF